MFVISLLIKKKKSNAFSQVYFKSEDNSIL